MDMDGYVFYGYFVYRVCDRYLYANILVSHVYDADAVRDFDKVNIANGATMPVYDIARSFYNSTLLSRDMMRYTIVTRFRCEYGGYVLDVP